MTARVLVFGYGNPGRLDDGLGPALARELALRDLGGTVAIESGYQLAIEDAALVAQQDLVVFADADRTGPEPFELRPLAPSREAAFTTHALAPAALLGLARDHFGCRTEAFLLGIRGYEFNEFGERLSARAQRNLEAAVEYLARVLEEGSLAHETAGAGTERLR